MLNAVGSIDKGQVAINELLAGVGAWCFSSAAQAAERTVRLERRIEPDAERMKRYQTRYEVYRDIYPAVSPINRRL